MQSMYYLSVCPYYIEPQSQRIIIQFVVEDTNYSMSWVDRATCSKFYPCGHRAMSHSRRIGDGDMTECHVDVLGVSLVSSLTDVGPSCVVGETIFPHDHVVALSQDVRKTISQQSRVACATYVLS